MSPISDSDTNSDALRRSDNFEKSEALSSAERERVISEDDPPKLNAPTSRNLCFLDLNPSTFVVVPRVVLFVRRASTAFVE